MTYIQAQGHLYKTAQIHGSNQVVQLVHHVRPDPAFGQTEPFLWILAANQEFSVFASELHSFTQ